MISFNPFLYFLFFPCSSRFALRRFEDGADLTWLGQLTEAERLIINMLKNVVFRSGHDSQLRNTLKGSTLPADILCHDPFKTMMETIHEEIEKVKAAEEKEANEDESDEDSPAQKNVIVHDLLPRMSLELDHEDEKAQQLMAFAKQAQCRQWARSWKTACLSPGPKGRSLSMTPRLQERRRPSVTFDGLSFAVSIFRRFAPHSSEAEVDHSHERATW